MAHKTLCTVSLPAFRTALRKAIRIGAPIGAPIGGAATAVLMAAVFAVLAVNASPAMADTDADRARAALRAGEIVPLARVLDAVNRTYNGDVLDVELDHDDGQWIYEVKLLLPDGGVAKLKYDARTVALIKSKGAKLDSARKAP
ncbi:PepSY domain-containing protein [Cupriavidus plantarum]|uniref:YpeB-like protein with putative protease inhibitory function n=1 Tax=Cupriavidus plantarum TaxID=942865 RepID=A0A316FML4_9BURK|nr:PepSY domain-containing protein [Cupriavidus plantarum]PWK38910.1 YpeB-like protein with putative protease inhibitory function [Cupriavidus plantarum]